MGILPIASFSVCAEWFGSRGHLCTGEEGTVVLEMKNQTSVAIMILFLRRRVGAGIVRSFTPYPSQLRAVVRESRHTHLDT